MLLHMITSFWVLNNSAGNGFVPKAQKVELSLNVKTTIFNWIFFIFKIVFCRIFCKSSFHIKPICMQTKMVYFVFLAVVNRGTCTNTSECNERELCRNQQSLQQKLCIRKMYHLSSQFIKEISLSILFLHYANVGLFGWKWIIH